MHKHYSNKQIKEEKSIIFDTILEYMKLTGTDPELKNFIVNEQKFWAFINKDFSFIKNKVMLREYYVAIYMIKWLKNEFELSLAKEILFLWKDQKTLKIIFELKLGIMGLKNPFQNKIEVNLTLNMMVSEDAILCFTYKNQSKYIDLTQKDVMKNITLTVFELLFKKIKTCHSKQIDDYFKDKINGIKEQYSDVLHAVDIKVIPDFDYLFSMDKKTEYFPFYVIVNEKYKIQVRDIKDNLVNDYIAENTIVFLEKENLLNKITGEKHEKGVKRL